MKRKNFLAAVLFTMACVIVPVTHAQERGTKDEAKALVESAVAHVKKVGAEQAFKDFQTDKATWMKKDLYVFAYDMQGNCRALVANDKMVGKNLIEMKDPNGKFIIKEFISTVSSKGAGWINYEFADPTTKKMGSKSSYVQKLPGFDGLVGVGVYL
jgi:signal transduction histidine kinase